MAVTSRLLSAPSSLQHSRPSNVARSPASSDSQAGQVITNLRRRMRVDLHRAPETD